MPYVGGRYMTADEYQDAKNDVAYDEFLERAVECAECGTKYDPKVHRATRSEPAWAEVEECPNCGCADIA